LKLEDVVVKETKDVEEVEMDYGKAKSVKDVMSEMLAEWLFKDFGILIDEPSEKEIAETLEEHNKEVLDDGVNKR
jgi:hypothetical protein